MANKKIDQFYKTLEEHTGERKFAFIYSTLQIHEIQKDHIKFYVPSDIIKRTVEAQKSLLQKICQEVWDTVEDISIQVNSDVNATNFSAITTPAHQAHQKTESAVTVKREEKKERREKRTGLLSDFTFDNFLVGPTNDFAANVAKAIANNPGQTSNNPCLIYGGVGLGKTHLLHAIGNKVGSTRVNFEILCLTAEDFLNDFVKSLKDKTEDRFKNRIRGVDLLLIDDIQFLSNKTKTQDVLFHAFNSLHHHSKQMVFSCDRPINEIKDVEERLISRFQSGMCVDLHPPNPDLAREILHKALEYNKQEDLVSKEIVDYVSVHLRNNIRNMLSFLNRITAYAIMTKRSITLEMVQEWALDFKPKRQRKQTITNVILKEVSQYYNISLADLKTRGKKKSISKVRRVAMYLLREYTELSHTEIGEIFQVSHVSSSNAVQFMETQKSLGTELSGEIKAISAKLFN